MDLQNQLNQKLSFLKDIKSLTYNLSDAVMDEKIEMLDDILSARQCLMDRIDEIDKIINSYNINSENREIKDEIRSEIKNIIEIDSKVKSLISKKELEIRRKFTEADLKLKTGNFDMEDKEIKPLGYFLNVKS